MDDQCCTPLHVAVALGSEAVSVLLLEAGAQCDSTSLACSALCAAISSRNFNCFFQLLHFGANVMLPLGPHGPLSCVVAAVRSGCALVVNAIIIHLKTHHSHELRKVCEMQEATDGSTLPLIWLENSRESDGVTLDILKLLILGGSDALQCNHSLVYPLHIATARGFQATIHCISRIAQCRLLSIVSCRSPSLKIRTDIPNCLAAGARYDFADETGLLSLHVCAAIGSAAALESLVSSVSAQRSGSIDCVDSKGHNALCHAVTNDRTDLLPILIRSNVPQMASCGCSALGHAVIMLRPECIRVLLATSRAHIGQDAVLVTRLNPALGVDSLQLACSIGDVNVLKTLLDSSSLPSSLNTIVYNDGGSIVHYVASLQLNKRSDYALQPSPAANPTAVSTLLATVLAQAGATFLRRNNEVLVLTPLLRILDLQSYFEQGLTAIDMFRMLGDVDTANALEGA
jgi:ankyrin repeat protein